MKTFLYDITVRKVRNKFFRKSRSKSVKAESVQNTPSINEEFDSNQLLSKIQDCDILSIFLTLVKFHL